MTEMSVETIESLARLAQLSLTPEEVARFGPQLRDVVSYLDTLAAVDVEGVPEYTAPTIGAGPLRADAASEPLPREQALAGAMSVRDGLVVVPKFKED